MNFAKLATGLIGAAFGLRTLDDSKPVWARIAYGAVAFDLISSAVKNEHPPLLGKAEAKVESAKAPLNFKKTRVRTIQERVAKVHEQLIQGTHDPAVYALAREVLTKKCGDDWCVPQKDHRAEVTALFDEVKKRVRYTWDPVAYDAFQTPRKTLALKAGDCLPATTLVLTGGYKLTPIGEVREGDLIMGDGCWTRVTKFWEKGEKKLLEFSLNNGCVLRCTPDHKLFVVRRGEAVEKRAKDVKPGDDLLQPKGLPLGHESMDPEKAWLLGAFIADGWSEEYRCAIAGKDGHPKEMQKRRVEKWCKENGIETRWHERYISINNTSLTAWLSAAGRGALNKHVPSLDLDERTIRAVLSGLEADSTVSKSGSRVYSTISQELALQLRVMFRMLGQSVHISKVDEHGGLGKHPIYRVTVRKDNTRRPHAKVLSVREAPAERVVDIETETHRFWLPESDVVVHNCDDYVSLLGALCRSVGIKVRSRIVQTQGEPTWNHIYLVAQMDDGSWMSLDPTILGKGAGYEVPDHIVLRKQDFDVVENGAGPQLDTP